MGLHLPNRVGAIDTHPLPLTMYSVNAPVKARTR